VSRGFDLRVAALRQREQPVRAVKKRTFRQPGSRERVAQDGRVIGIVAHDVSIRPDVAPFYRGIPGGEVVRCLNEMGFGHLVRLEIGCFDRRRSGGTLAAAQNQDCSVRAT